MKTPDGRECTFYYEDYHRGRNEQECRLIKENPDSEPWQPHICAKCPVPEILRVANLDNIKLEATIKKKWLGFVQEVEVVGWCSQCFSVVPDPKLGCPNCSGDRPSILDLVEGPP